MDRLHAIPKAWLAYLVDRRFDREPELRNKIFVLFVYALVETNEDIDARLHGLTVRAHKMKSSSCIYYLGKIRFMLEAAADLAGFSFGAMILIGELRQQWVHGRLDSHFKDSRKIRFIQSGKVKARNVHHAEYWRLYEEQGGARNLDLTIESLRHRFVDARTMFWLVYFALDQHMEMIRAQLHEHSNFASPLVDFISPKGYAGTKAQTIAAGGCVTLRQVRNQKRFARSVAP